MKKIVLGLFCAIAPLILAVNFIAITNDGEKYSFSNVAEALAKIGNDFDFFQQIKDIYQGIKLDVTTEHLQDLINKFENWSGGNVWEIITGFFEFMGTGLAVTAQGILLIFCIFFLGIIALLNIVYNVFILLLQTMG